MFIQLKLCHYMNSFDLHPVDKVVKNPKNVWSNKVLFMDTVLN
jgi:hypothetical protein